MGEDRPDTPGGALEALARELHWKMEALDPSDGRDWRDLSDREREFYRLSVRAVLANREIVALALS